jgi:hypothetical protein
MWGNMWTRDSKKKCITKSTMIRNLEFYPRTAQHYLAIVVKKAFPKQGDVFGRPDPTNPPHRGMDRPKKASTGGRGITDPSANLAIEVEGQAISVASEGVHEAPHQIGELVIIPGHCPCHRGRRRRHRR